MRPISPLKWSLIALLIPSSLVSLGMLMVGLTFGASLWQVDRPFAIAMWFATVLFPALLIVAVRSAIAPRRFYTLAALAWLFVAFWAFHTFLWRPWLVGGPWGW